MRKTAARGRARPGSLAVSLALALLTVAVTGLLAQEQSVAPGANDRFKNPDANVETFVQMFEGESREIYRNRERIVGALGLRPGMSVGDVGAGTGFFARMIAERVGKRGRVFAVDIAPSMLAHMKKLHREMGISNIDVIQGEDATANLPDGKLDVVFVCDTYHHFEFPYRMLESIHRSLKEAGELIVVDFERINNLSSSFAMGHVRAGKGTFSDEIRDSGFDFVEEVPLMRDQYFLRFKKRSQTSR